MKDKLSEDGFELVEYELSGGGLEKVQYEFNDSALGLVLTLGAPRALGVNGDILGDILGDSLGSFERRV